LGQRFIASFLISVPSGHPCFAFPASIPCLLFRSFFILMHRDGIIESATARALIKNGKQPLIKLMSDVKLLGSSYGLTPAGSRKARPIADIRLVCEARGIPITSADGKYIDRAVLEKAIVEKLGLKKEKSESPGASAKMNLHRLNQLLW